MADYKKWGMKALEYALGGIITVVGGNYLVPYLNQYVTIISQTPLPFVNLSVHQIIAYGIGFGVAYWLCKKYFSRQQ